MQMDDQNAPAAMPGSDDQGMPAAAPATPADAPAQDDWSNPAPAAAPAMPEEQPAAAPAPEMPADNGGMQQ